MVYLKNTFDDHCIGKENQIKKWPGQIVEYIFLPYERPLWPWGNLFLRAEIDKKGGKLHQWLTWNREKEFDGKRKKREWKRDKLCIVKEVVVLLHKSYRINITRSKVKCLTWKRNQYRRKKISLVISICIQLRGYTFICTLKRNKQTLLVNYIVSQYTGATSVECKVFGRMIHWPRTQ